MVRARCATVVVKVGRVPGPVEPVQLVAAPRRHAGSRTAAHVESWAIVARAPLWCQTLDQISRKGWRYTKLANDPALDA